MHCGGCGRVIDPETDRHLEVVERIHAPDLGLEGAEGAIYCEACMDLRVANLESLALR